jgi:hypothetical protein
MDLRTSNPYETSTNANPYGNSMLAVTDAVALEAKTTNKVIL